MRRTFLWALLPALVLFLVAPAGGNTDVVTNITSLPTDPGYLGTTITHTGVHLYDIGGGTRPGDGTGPILFHSFRDFSVGQSDIANFLNDSGLMTTNIIGRVTGGNPSSIDGIIRTTGFDVGGVQANLFLVNPFGIVFGPHGSFDVGGSVSFSTAHYLRLFDSLNGVSTNFYADYAKDASTNSVFTMASVLDFGFLSPAAYGFLTAPDPSATITVQGSNLSILPALPDTPPNSISLVGGKVVIEGGAQLSAPNGRIHLATTASPGEFAALPGESLANATSLQSVPNNPVDPASATSFTSYGLMSLAPGSSIDVHDTSTVWIKGGQLVLSVNDATLNTSASTAQLDTISHSLGSSIVTSNAGADPGADVQLIASNVQLDGASIQSTTTGAGSGGNISITDAKSVSLTKGTQIVSSTSGAGVGGDITISATDVSISGFDTTGTLNGVTTLLVDPNSGLPVVTSGVFTTASASANENGGQISITTPVIVVDNGGTIATLNAGNGRGGDVKLTGGTVSFTNGGQLLSSAGFDGSNITGTGQGGNLTVTATDSLLLSGINPNLFSLLTSDVAPSSITSLTLSASGNGGNITANVKTLDVTDNAVIQSLNLSSGAGGTITVQGLPGAQDNADESVTLNNGVISTQSLDQGPSGTVEVTTGLLTIENRARIFTAQSGSEAGGDLILAANKVVLSGDSQITTTTGDAADGGGIFITAGSLELSGASTSISSSNSGTGLGGNITLSVQDATLSGGATIKSSTDCFCSFGGAGGTIIVQGLPVQGTPVPKAESLTLRGNGSGIMSQSLGTGPFGTIEVHANTVSLTNDAVIQSGTPQVSASTAGNVIIDADSVGISSGSSIRSAVFAASGGQVNITANQLDLNNGSILTNTIALGQAGATNISASGSLTMTNGSTISASSTGSGDAGEVIVTTPALSLNDATITTSTSSTGNAGSITANVGTLTLSNGAEISSSGTGTASGSAGSITIQGLVSPANSVTITDSSLLTSAANTGQGGNVTVSATNLALNNATVSASVTNFDNSPGSGDRAIDGLGNINLTASTMTMTGSTVTTESSGARNAGDIKINPEVASNSFQMQNSMINTSAALADGGNIEINATNMVHLTNSIITSSVGNETKTDTLGGNITIDPQFVILQNSQIIAQAFAGAGGNIDITSNVFLADPNSLVDASSQLGISGTVNIQAPVQNISGELVVLSHDFSSAAALLAQQCAARVADGKFSTFVVAAREGLPIELGGFLASPSFLTDGVPALSGQLPQTPRAATEGSLPKYDVRPLQLAKLGNACQR